MVVEVNGLMYVVQYIKKNLLYLVDLLRVHCLSLALVYQYESVDCLLAF